MVLRNFEDRLERLVEGMFARAFRSGLQPVELGRRLVKEMDASRTLDVRGRTLAPNRFVIRVSPEDQQRFAQVQQSLVQELHATVREHAAAEELTFLDGGVYLSQAGETQGFVIWGGGDYEVALVTSRP